jgi:glycosyltransferase involved in cell wall biosynthesis
VGFSDNSENAVRTESQEFPTIEDLDDIPPSFYHYLWACGYCADKSVTELGCRNGFGARILSTVAAKCTGIDTNRAAIKYAMRNFYWEGRNKFVTAQDATQYVADSEVVISFNSETTTSGESLPNFIKSIFDGIAVGGEKSLIVSLGSQNGADLDFLLSSLEKTCSALSLEYSLHLQRATDPAKIEPFQNDPHDIHRIIAIVKSQKGPVACIPIAASSTKDLVSIIIPTFNRADLIDESIDSALGQTYSDIEVIVIDDGSTDNTKDVIARYGARIKYYHKENGGIGSALNFGIKKMNGHWFKWLSSDDVLTLDAVETLVSFANSTGAMVMYTDYDIIDDESKFVRKFVEPHYQSYYEFASALWTRFVGNGSSSLIAKSCFEEVGLFDETVRSAEDYDWWLRACLLHGYRFFHIPQTTLKYRTHGKQLTAAVKHNAYATDEKIRKKIKEQIVSSDPKWWNTLSHYQRLYSKQNEHRGMARRLLRKSLLHMPEGVRKSALGTWQRSLKPKAESRE